MRVRLINNPTRIGVLTGRKQIRGDREYHQVQFPDNLEFKPKEQLEDVPDSETPIDLLATSSFGVPSDLRKVLIHAKVSGRMADVVYSMNTTNTNFYAYQFKPVLKILDSPSNSLLIADEVGLGKTIEAGLIWTELRMRYNFNRIMVLCPATLREKWQIELSKRFGIDARICNAKETLDTLKGKAKYKKDIAVIGSLQGLRPSNPNDLEDLKSPKAQLEQFLESRENEEPIIDLLIIDEAHHMRNTGTKTRRLGQLFSDISDYKIFLTATPIHNHNRDLFSLLQLLDPSTFTNEFSFENILSANKPLIKARNLVLRNILDSKMIMEIIKEAKHHPLLEENNQLENIQKFIESGKNLNLPHNKSLLAHKLEYVNLLSNVLTRTRKREVTEWRVLRKPLPEFVEMTSIEQEYYDYVTSIVTNYAQECGVNERFLLAQPQRQITSSIPASLEYWINKLNNYIEKENEEEEEEMGPLVTEIFKQILNSNKFDLKTLKENDSKYNSLHKAINNILKDKPKEKIILFSTFRATLFYINQKLDQDNISNIVMVGGQKKSKDEIIKEFARENGPSVLLSSEVGSEGVDMQFSKIVINYDLPWNPMKVEQRIGRIDRLGQTSDQIFIWNLFYKNTIDARIYERLYQRLNLIQNSLGDFEAVLGEHIQKLEVDLITTQLTPEQQEERIEQTAIALENLKRTEETLENQSADLVAYGDYILSQIHTARDLERWITSEDIRQYITDYLTLNYQGSRILYEGKENSYSILLPIEAKAKFLKHAHENNLARTSFNSQQDFDIKCRFDNKIISAKSTKIETINQYHPLVKWISHEIAQNKTPLRPTVAINLEIIACHDFISKGDYLICINKWMFDGVRKIDRLEYRGIDINTKKYIDPNIAEKLSVTAALKGTYLDTFEIESEILVDIANHHLLNQLQDSYEEFVSEQSAKNEDRLQIQLKNIQENYKRRLQGLQDVKLSYERRGKESLVKATEGRIKKLLTRTETVIKQIELNRAFKSESTELAIALIKVS